MFRKSALTLVAASVVSLVPLMGPLAKADAATAPRHSNPSLSEVKMAPEESFALKNKKANECLDGNSDSLMWSCNGSAVQQWKFVDAGEGKVHLLWARGTRNDKCVNDEFRYVECDSRDAAKFTLETVNETYVFHKIKNDMTGECLSTVWRPHMRNWALAGATCSNSDKQLWIKQ